VRFRERKIGVYGQIYDVTPDDVFEVVREEHRGGRRALYLKGRRYEAWIPAWPSDLLLVQLGPAPL
jgi:hypothetical protein